ncbi:MULTISPECIES: hypothetical protein [Rhizobium]|jgi:hypothetical protein|uniref:Uncharacterized protein n=4 Tax=Rhizobium TaxID=379 RepID=A0ABU1SLP6_9HYPH|nr:MULTISPECIES: hypothetical protein [Rhizobium]AGB70538.1 hypothetical protein RTCIAT899_CH05650 [Rhizobium tropici CIAT 899]MBB3382788.1 hypothetical protein [Rhizobium sp. BK098]MBB3425224.1 hypothetical protein [Rhizobium sp. BK312]MBB3568485.1 hypothetical protein [Rhizobium sp. BK491]MBB3614489.1 hypothetical protein [Rhizobium sp. BK609]
MDSIIIARRFVVIMLFAAVFAFSFSVAVEHAGRSGAQSHFGASFTCVQTGAPYCTTVQ